MAAVQQGETVKISINDIEIDVPKGELIVESVKRLGLEIPIFCYHPRMKPVGMCRMCLVEVGFKQPDGSVRKMPKPQAGCTLPASDGMVIYTDSEMVHRDRKGVLEFLLINHPLDCPICDRGGECPLQNNTIFYGPSTSRYIEVKRHAPKAFPLSQFVTLDLERCIQCGRCVRFTEEISGDEQLAFRFRGAAMQPSTFEMTDFDSKFSGNVIEICPVGALTSAKYRFRARPWDLETRPAICTNCSNGCNTWFDYRAGRYVRTNGRTNEAVNEEWTCDKGKFGHDFYNSEKRLTQPMIRRGDNFVACSWAEAYEEILSAFSSGGNRVGALVGGTVSNEGLFLLQKLFRTAFNSNNLDHRWTKALPDALERRYATVQTKLADVETKSNILVFGSALSDELPILHLRVRKAWFSRQCKVVVAHDQPTDADRFGSLVLRYRSGSEDVLAHGLLAEAIRQGRAQDMPTLTDDYSPERIERETGVSPELIRRAIEILGENGAIISSHSIFDKPQAQDTVETLANLANSMRMEFNCYPLGANDRGASLLGVLPDAGPSGEIITQSPGLGTHGMIAAAAKGQMDALWLVEADPLASNMEKGLVMRALENVPFLVYQGILANDSMNYASVILPMEAPAEQDGTYTNLEGRVQRMRQIIPGQGEAKQAWRVFAELILRLKPVKPYFNAGEIMDEIADSVPGFAEARFERLPIEGYSVGRPTFAGSVSETN